MEKQELLLLETTQENLYHWKEEIVMAPPGKAANGLMIYSLQWFYQNPLMGVLAIFYTGTYAGISMVCQV